MRNWCIKAQKEHPAFLTASNCFFFWTRSSSIRLTLARSKFSWSGLSASWNTFHLDPFWSEETGHCGAVHRRSRTESSQEDGDVLTGWSSFSLFSSDICFCFRISSFTGRRRFPFETGGGKGGQNGRQSCHVNNWRKTLDMQFGTFTDCVQVTFIGIFNQVTFHLWSRGCGIQILCATIATLLFFCSHDEMTAKKINIGFFKMPV